MPTIMVLSPSLGQRIELRVGPFNLSAKSAAAIWVHGRASDADIDVAVANGSQLHGDGILIQLSGDRQPCRSWQSCRFHCR
jgi:autotransporter family porin